MQFSHDLVDITQNILPLGPRTTCRGKFKNQFGNVCFTKFSDFPGDQLSKLKKQDHSVYPLFVQYLVCLQTKFRSCYKFEKEPLTLSLQIMAPDQCHEPTFSLYWRLNVYLYQTIIGVNRDLSKRLSPNSSPPPIHLVFIEFVI